MPLPIPPPAVSVALASVAAHMKEALGPDGHPADLYAVQGALETPGVADYLAELDELGLLPVARS